MNLLTKIAVGGLLMLTLIGADAQSRINNNKALDVTFNKTSTIIFPAIIKSVDRGSRDLLVQKARGVENVLQLKAAKPNFSETNLTVITADGEIHQFTIRYAKEPHELVLEFGDAYGEGSRDSKPVIFKTEMTEMDMDRYASKIVNARRNVRFVRKNRFKIGFGLEGIYGKDNILFFHVRIENQSHINYDVDLMRIYIQDKEKPKRTASQEITLNPIYIYGNDAHILRKTDEDVVYALEKFTIPNAKRLIIEMYEKKGGRNMSLSIKNNTIVKARPID